MLYLKKKTVFRGFSVRIDSRLKGPDHGENPQRIFGACTRALNKQYVSTMSHSNWYSGPVHVSLLLGFVRVSVAVFSDARDRLRVHCATPATR